MQQADLAEALSLNQPAISRFEKREDVKISTLTAYLEAMGGRLDIRAHFDDLGISVDLRAYVQSR
jgi:transcriptional regulator with XRE-family HTH domain